MKKLMMFSAMAATGLAAPAMAQDATDHAGHAMDAQTAEAPATAPQTAAPMAEGDAMAATQVTVFLVVLILWSKAALGLVLVVALAPLILAFRRLDVTVSAAGVTIAYGLNGWPRQHIHISDIVGVGVERVGWRSSGGLGYRGSLRLFKQARVLVRHGECLRLDMVRGRRLWVSVDDAEGAVAVLADLGVGD